MVMYIYVITNMVNLKKYIGCTTKDPMFRWKQHIYNTQSYGNPRAIHKAMIKYGIYNFTFQVIDEFTSSDEMYKAEKEYITLFNTFHGDGYNMTSGGELISQYKWTEEDKNRQSLAQTGSKNNMFGKKHTDNTKHLIGEKSKQRTQGKDNPMYGKTGNKSPHAKKVYQYDLETGEVLMGFLCAEDAGLYIGSKKQMIQRVCNGNRSKHKGYGWGYA